MDHVEGAYDTPWWPTQPVHIRLQTYDNGGFHGFLERKGIKSEDILWYKCKPDDVPDRFRDTLKSLTQEWLLFGVLHEFSMAFDIPVDLSIFTILDEDGIFRITTRYLLTYCESLLDSIAEKYVPADLLVGMKDCPLDDLAVKIKLNFPQEIALK